MISLIEKDADFILKILREELKKRETYTSLALQKSFNDFSEVFERELTEEDKDLILKASDDYAKEEIDPLKKAIELLTIGSSEN